MNIIDRLVSFFNPAAGVARAKARMYETRLNDGRRAYEAATRGRRAGDWKAGSTGANNELLMAQRILRDRSRDQIRNNPYAKKAKITLVTNIVGDGIKIAISHESEQQKKRIAKAWKGWAEKTVCDYEGKKTLAAIQSMCVGAVVESGEVFLRRRWVNDKNLKIPLQLQVLECDFLDSFKDGISTPGGGYITQGIEFNTDGKIVAYWMFPYHPGENRVGLSLTSARIPAAEILHIYYAERPGQLRGAPVGVSSMLRLRDVDEYSEAERIRKKVAACFAVFVTDPNGDPVAGSANPDGGYQMEHVEPGMIEYLAPGKQVTMSTPPTSDGYAEYSRTELHAIAAGFGVTYESITNDYSQVNFSSGRMGWIEMGKIVAEYQSKMVIPVLCDGVWQWFLTAATLVGVAKNDAEAEWTAPRREMLDPVKETKALSELVRNGFASWQDIIRQLGDDPATVMAELSADYATFDKNDMMLACDPRYDTNRVDPAAQQPVTAK